MPLSTYTYSVSNDTANGVVDYSRLRLEIQNSDDISIALSHINVDGDTLEIVFKASLASPEETALNQILDSHTGKPLPNPVSDQGIPLRSLHGEDNKVQIVGRKGDEVIKVTHDFTEPCTWYGDSVRVTEVLTDSGDGLTWNSARKNWIDPQSPKLHDSKGVIAEGKAKTGDAWGYLPQVRVQGTLQSPRPRRANDWSLGGDYYIDYPNGQVVFETQPSEAPEVTYHYATGSACYIVPSEGRSLEIEMAEVQWSVNVDFNADIIQQVEVPDGEGGWDPVEVGWYSSFWELLDEARGSFPRQGPVGGTPGWRGTNGQEVEHAPLVYNAIKAIKASLGMRMAVYIGHVEYDKDGNMQVTKVAANPSVVGGGFGGDHASSTFYAVSIPE